MGMSVGSVKIFFKTVDESDQSGRFWQSISIGNGCILAEWGCRSAVTGPAEHRLCQGLEGNAHPVCHGCRDVSLEGRGIVVVFGVDRQGE